MKILGHIGNEPISPLALKQLSEFLHCHKIDAESKTLNSQVSLLWVDLSVSVSKALLDCFPSLETIVTCTTGLTHIDLMETVLRKINIISLKGHNKFLNTITASSEHAWTLLMSANCNLVNAHKSVQRGEWSRTEIIKHQLQGKNLGIIGLGRIGQNLKHYAHAFGMNVYAFDTRQNLPLLSDLILVKSLDNLLELSDFIVLSASVQDNYTKVIGREQLKKVRNNAVLVNISRGCLVDEIAIAEALETNKLAFYATDVLSFEDFSYARSRDLSNRNPFLGIANSIVTPHIGGYSVDARINCELHLIRFLKEGSCGCDSI